MVKSGMHIPLVDLVAQYKSIRKEIDEAIEEVISKGHFIGGDEVKKFAVEFANISNTAYCIPCANGTDAMEIALTALGVGRNDEVIIPAFSFVATLEAVCNVGAVPVLCDIDPQRYSISAKEIEALITSRTKAVIPVHLYGQMADMDPIVALCKKKKLYLIEDAAQAHKAEYKGFMAGSLGDFGTFSFYPGKNLGAYGDAGAITTNNEEYHDIVFKMANHGRTSKYDHIILGRNSRMDTLQAAVLNVKSAHLEDWIKARRKVARQYGELLKEVEQIQLPAVFAESESVYHLYVIRVRKERREEFRNYLSGAGIETGIHYPVALSKLRVTTEQLEIFVNCPEAEKASEEVVSLPIYPELSSSQVEYICDHIKQFFTATTHHSGSPVIHAGKQHPGKKKG